MSRPVASTNGRNSSTVTALVATAKGCPINTQWGGFSNEAELPSARFDPCLNRPAGTIVIAGQVGQSRMTEPALGAAASVMAGIFAGGARWTNAHATSASSAIAALTQPKRTIAPAPPRPREPNKG